MSNPTDTNQASEDELREAVRDGLANHTGEFVNPWIFRKSYSHEELTDMLDDIMASERLFKKLQSLIRTEKLKLLAEVRERVVGEDEKLVIPDYPKTDDEGEPLYSKRAAKEGRKQVTARYHTRKELRNDQRTELAKLEAEL